MSFFYLFIISASYYDAGFTLFLIEKRRGKNPSIDQILQTLSVRPVTARVLASPAPLVSAHLLYTIFCSAINT